MFHWYSPVPSEIPSSRISLDFGLRAADLYFRELVVPELGRTWFVRQFSWPLAALALYESIQGQGSNAPRPTAICHGIESLACKLEFRVDPRDTERILGSRAFARDVDSLIWTFERLRQPSNYVHNTHRQAAARALRRDGGLGFVTGTRFDHFELEPVGRALAEAFLEQRVGKGGTSLSNWLIKWLRGERDLSGGSDTLLAALSPKRPTTIERNLVQSRVLETSTAASETRQRLARAIGRAADLPDIEGTVVPRLRDAGYRKQAADIIAARTFGAVLDRARDATATLTSAVESGRGSIPVATLARDGAVGSSLSSLKTVAKRFLAKMAAAGLTESTSCAFSNALVGADYERTIRLMVGNVGEVLSLSNGSVIRGALFRVVESSERLEEPEDAAARINSDLTERTFRIKNLHSLLRDFSQRKIS